MLFTREMIEQREREMLSPYGMKSGDTQGRVEKEDPPKYRTEFQRDRDRILHTTAFRRLVYKTQVFVNFEGDYFRTRLTHTLEVAQIGRTLARILGANEDLVEAVCIVHDIGHPPFGHSGEQTLSMLMEDYGGFDHNEQALRIVTSLERRFPDFNGLNLTYETREGIVKHETEYDVSNVAPEYHPEKGAGLEAQIANVSDELAYTAHDLDDGLYAGLLVPAELDGLQIWKLLRDELGFENDEFNELTRHRLIRRLIGILVRDVVETTVAQLNEHNPQSVDDLQSLNKQVMGHGEEIGGMVRELKDYLYANMYRHYRVARMAKRAERFISELFNTFIEEPAQLPPQTQAKLENGPNTLERVVCDYIAGMTDRYALQEYEKLFDPFVRP